jgi:hypothetical protein
MFLKPKDLAKVRVSSLLSLVTNTGLGLVSYPHKTSMDIQWNKTDLGIVRVHYGTSHYLYYYYYYHHHYYNNMYKHACIHIFNVKVSSSKPHVHFCVPNDVNWCLEAETA